MTALRALRSAPPQITLVVCCMGQFMVLLDVTIVDVALPQMRHGLGLSVASSLVGGLADSGSWLIAARAGQGFGAATLAPATLSLLTSRFTDLTSGARHSALGQQPPPAARLSVYWPVASLPAC